MEEKIKPTLECEIKVLKADGTIKIYTKKEVEI